MLDGAKQLVELGLPIIPLCSHDHAGASPQHIQRCKCPGKSPMIKGWQDHNSTSLVDLQSWDKSFKNWNIGLPLGDASGYCGIDVDGDDIKESGRIRTKSYRPTQQASDLMEQLKKSGRYNINDEKDDLGIKTPEINSDAPLSDLQLKEILGELSEPVRRVVVAKISPKENPKLDELNEWITEAEMITPEEIEEEEKGIEEENEEEWEWDSDDEHERHRRPPVY